MNNEKLDCLRDADWIVRDEIKKAGLYNDIWQAFAVLLPVKTVGVMGDKRTYAWPIVLRCVSSVLFLINQIKVSLYIFHLSNDFHSRFKHLFIVFPSSN